ncbi:MAG: hypothetical protein Q8P56_06710 [Candidatus Uhrbacteria bacterium]|nr:hypothetical protein [Candidatus Uhrbacteria bacterium]
MKIGQRFITVFKNISCAVSFALVFFATKASALTSANTGLSQTAGRATLKVGQTVPQYVGGIVSAILGIVGVVFLILIVYGGILWMLAEGDDTKVGKARGLIFHAIIGLILVFSAYAITNFVVDVLITQSIQ